MEQDNMDRIQRERGEALRAMGKTPQRARDLNLLIRELMENVEKLRERAQELEEYARATMEATAKILDRSATVGQLVRTSAFMLTGENHWDDEEETADEGEPQMDADER